MPHTLSSITVPSSSPSPAHWSRSVSPPPFPSFLSTSMDSAMSESRPSAFIVSDKLLAGGFAGATARTIVAPFDRLKMLMQTQRSTTSTASSSNSISRAATASSSPARSASTIALPTSSPLKYTSTLQGLRTIVHEEGMLALWKGNMLNVMRVFPYSAVQFGSYDVFKQALLAASTSASSSASSTSTTTTQSLSPIARLACGAMAGVCATTITHPMDVLRLRVSVQRDVNTFGEATRQLVREGGVRALFKGYVPTLLSVCPFIAVNFACFDWLSSQPFAQARASSPACTMLLGATSAMIAQSACYPLDTVRRQMQMPGVAATSTLHAMRAIVQQQGFRALYAGIVPNAVKVVPANAMRFFIFDLIQKQLRGSPTDAIACL